jgi:hypothetical protein
MSLSLRVTLRESGALSSSPTSGQFALKSSYLFNSFFLSKINFPENLYLVIICNQQKSRIRNQQKIIPDSQHWSGVRIKKFERKWISLKRKLYWFFKIGDNIPLNHIRQDVSSLFTWKIRMPLVSLTIGSRGCGNVDPGYLFTTGTVHGTYHMFVAGVCCLAAPATLNHRPSLTKRANQTFRWSQGGCGLRAGRRRRRREPGSSLW